MEHDAIIAPETLAAVEPHGAIDDADLENVRIDGPENPDPDPIVPDPDVEIDED